MYGRKETPCTRNLSNNRTTWKPQELLVQSLACHLQNGPSDKSTNMITISRHKPTEGVRHSLGSREGVVGIVVSRCHKFCAVLESRLNLTCVL